MWVIYLYCILNANKVDPGKTLGISGLAPINNVLYIWLFDEKPHKPVVKNVFRNVTTQKSWEYFLFSINNGNIVGRYT